MTEPAPPTFKPRQMGFFSEWIVHVAWPDGRTKDVYGFKNEAHARGWIAQESGKWLAENSRPGFWESLT